MNNPKLDITFYIRYINTLNRAYTMLVQTESESIDYEMYRSACIKEFEIILEQSGKLLRKILRPYFHSSRATDELNFKDLFRQAVLRNIISPELCERFLEYRDNRNITAHDYGVKFAEETLQLIPRFIDDTLQFSEILKKYSHDAEG